MSRTRIYFFVLLVSILYVGLLSCGKERSKMAENEQLPDFDSMWNYYAPDSTRVEFEKILPLAVKSGNQSYHLQLLTQIARTYGLEGKFDSANECLDEVEQKMTDELPLVKVRYLLERGRTFRSSGEVEKSVPLFEESYNLSKKISADNFTVDAAHMMAIAVKDFDEKMKWNLIGLKTAEESSDKKAQRWKGSLYNNIGWDYHDKKEYEKALDMFQKALNFREEQGKEREIDIAKWCVARCFRSLGRIDESLAIQSELYDKIQHGAPTDGYVYEELGELYLIKNDSTKAQRFFAQAYTVLSKDNWMMENETERMERMKKLGNISD